MRERRIEAHETLARSELIRTSQRMAEPSPTRFVRLVLVEDGTSGLEDHAPPDGDDQTLFIAQTGGERPADFARRAIRRISALEQGQQSVIRTILLLAPRFDAAAMGARVSLAHALVEHSAAMASGPSQLLLCAGGDLHQDLQAKVLGLVNTLGGKPGGGCLPISVQFAPDTALPPL